MPVRTAMREEEAAAAAAAAGSGGAGRPAVRVARGWAGVM